MNRIVFAHAQVFHYLYNTFIILISKRVYYSVKLPKYFTMATGSISTDSDPPESVSGVGNDSPKFCSPKGAKSPVWAHCVFAGSAGQTRECKASSLFSLSRSRGTREGHRGLLQQHNESPAALVYLAPTSSSQTTRRIVTVYSRQCLDCR